MGKITLVVNGPDQLARLAGAMLSFAEYSGVGIKTALGMGGVRIREIP
jgi:CRISPR/Cas system endoribonuclease Cas6 (RAMP superfamily)